MSPLLRIIRKTAGWLAIPASLLLFAGCASTQPETPRAATALASHTHAQEDGPFERAFAGEADVVVLTFFDLYCVACQQSASNFARIHEAIEAGRMGDNTAITGVGIGDTEFEVSVFLKRYPLPYPCLADPDKEWEQPFALRGTPTVLVFKRVGPDCREIYRHQGRLRSDDVEELVATVANSLSISIPQ